MEHLNLTGIRDHVGSVATLESGTVYLQPNLDEQMIEKMYGGFLLATIQMDFCGCQTGIQTFTIGKLGHQLLNSL